MSASRFVARSFLCISLVLLVQHAVDFVIDFAGRATLYALGKVVHVGTLTTVLSTESDISQESYAKEF